MSAYRDRPKEGTYLDDLGAGGFSPLYRPIRDLDPRITCLLRGISMGVIFGLIAGPFSALLIQTGVLVLPYFRLYGPLTGVEFYAIWTAVCICFGIPVCEVFCVCITPWRHIRGGSR